MVARTATSNSFNQNLITHICRSPDRGSIGGPCPKHPTAGDLGNLDDPPFQIGGEVLDQQVNRGPGVIFTEQAC